VLHLKIEIGFEVKSPWAGNGRPLESGCCTHGRTQTLLRRPLGFLPLCVQVLNCFFCVQKKLENIEFYNVLTHVSCSHAT
jgi:hypothetical protein